MNTDFLKELPCDLTEISQKNKKLIPMNIFLTFLKVDVVRSTQHLGYSNGWTQLSGSNNLVISGGILNGVEYLHNIKFKRNLRSVYNDYVNPFYIFEILKDNGKDFFINFYADEINKLLAKNSLATQNAQQALDIAKRKEEEAIAFWDNLRNG